MPKLALQLVKATGATQIEVLPENPARIYALLVNDGAVDIYLSLGAPAVLNTGILIKSAGGAFEINATNPWHGRIYAVSAAASSLTMVTY